MVSEEIIPERGLKRFFIVIFIPIQKVSDEIIPERGLKPSNKLIIANEQNDGFRRNNPRKGTETS